MARTLHDTAEIMQLHDAQPRWVRDLVNEFGESLLAPANLHIIYTLGPERARPACLTVFKEAQDEYLRTLHP